MTGLVLAGGLAVVQYCSPPHYSLAQPDYYLPLGIAVYQNHSLLDRESVEDILRYVLAISPRLLGVPSWVVLNALRNTRVHFSTCPIRLKDRSGKWETVYGANVGDDTYVYDRGFIYPAWDTSLVHEWLHRIIRAEGKYKGMVAELSSF